MISTDDMTGVDLTGIDVASAEILQFGTSRFLLAHVDAFVSASLAAGHTQKRVVVVQSSPRPAGREKAYALMRQPIYPLRIRGRREGQEVDETHQIDALAGCLIADEQWATLEALFVGHITHVVSNTADRGYEVPEGDSPVEALPRSFPCRLLKLLRARFEAGGAGVTLMPCELISDNGQVLRRLMLDLAAEHYGDDAFTDWLETRCAWVDTLVDRIVSEAIEPVGAVAEPYALWAVRRTPGLEMPCQHPDVHLVDEVEPFEKQKLHILNLSHTFLVHRWQSLALVDEITFVREAIDDPRLRAPLEALLEEVMPLLSRAWPALDPAAYCATTLERFENPFLDHRLSDIADNHEAKCQRRVMPLLALAEQHDMNIPLLRAWAAEIDGRR
ncbi:mannitol dehydrogenase [Kushneria sp. AK178]